MNIEQLKTIAAALHKVTDYRHIEVQLGVSYTPAVEALRALGGESTLYDYDETDDSPSRQIEAVRLMVDGVEFYASHTTKEW